MADARHICRRYDDAIRLLMEVIKVHPYLHDTYHTLGLAHEALGRQRQALDFYMIAVHMAPTDVDLWRRLASLSTDLGFFRQAIYCYTRVWLNLASLDCSGLLFASHDTLRAFAELMSVWHSVTDLDFGR